MAETTESSTPENENQPQPERAVVSEVPAPLTLATPLPAGAVLYKVDSSRATFAELLRDSRPAKVWTLWLSKLLRTRLPGSVNDSNVESLRPFEAAFESFPPKIRERMAGAVENLGTLGFDLQNPMCHAIIDRFNNSRTYFVALPRADGRAVARITLRSEGSPAAPKIHFYREFISELTTGEFLWSTSAKATLLAPKTVLVRRHLAAAAPVLWEAHQAALSQTPGVAHGRAAATREGAEAMLERHHALLRDFHLRRGLFRPMSDTDLQLAGAIDHTYAEASSGSLKYPEIVAEVERLQHRTSSWLGAAAILVISLLMFVLIGVGGKTGWTAGPQARQWLLILVAVLFFHELGHYVAMRVFHYRNVRMFFIPLFGAAVSGTHYSAPGWKKVVVSLMGPLPGILVGAALGSVGVVLHQPLLIKIALISLLLNGSNLIPVLPLDGGRVVQTLLFARHYAADAVFRAIAAGALIWLGIKIPERILLFVGVMMLLGIPLILRRGRIAAELRRQGLVPAPSDDPRIPPQVADAIIARLKGGAAAKVKQTNRAVAQSTLAVYEALCNRPPGWLATIGFGVMHVSAVVLAVVLALALYAAQGGRFGNLIRSMANAPRQTISPRDIEASGDLNPAVERRTIVANFTSASNARAAYASLSPTLSPGEAIEHFGQTILLAFPARDEAARKRHLPDIEQRTKNFAVGSLGFGGAMFRLTCVATDEATATQIRDELEQYVAVPPTLNLIPPWSPAASAPGVDWRRYSLARSTYLRLMRAGRNGVADPAHKELLTRVQEAIRRGDQEESKRISAELKDLVARHRKEDLDRIKATTDGSVDQVIVEKYLAFPPFTDSDDEDEEAPRAPKYDSPEYQALAQRMGQLPIVDGRTTPASRCFSAAYGSASTSGAMLNISYLNFEEPIEGAHALVDWLSSRGCRSMRYEFHIPENGALGD